MDIIAHKHNVKKTNYNQIKGSGLLPRGPICTLDKCRPISLPTPKKPKPMAIKRLIPKPLCAIKKSPKNNKWVLNGIHYPNFNSLWVNIPFRAFTILKTNG